MSCSDLAKWNFAISFQTFEMEKSSQNFQNERLSHINYGCPSLHTNCSDGSNTILSNIEQTRASFFKHRTNLNVFIYWWLNSNTHFWLQMIEHRTSNIVRPITNKLKSIDFHFEDFWRLSNKSQFNEPLLIYFSLEMWRKEKDESSFQIQFGS